MASPVFENSLAAAEYIRSRITPQPKVAIILGSGLGAFADRIESPVAIPYAVIPHFPRPTVVGHSGIMIVGAVNGAAIAAMQGRVHFYEGYSGEEITFPIRVLKQLGVEKLIVTNAAGGIRAGLEQGELVLIADHINFTGANPLVGPNEPRFGERFFDMTEAYSKRLRSLAQKTAQDQGFPLSEGVYLAVSGPSFETPAEIRAFRTLGADLVGMSTVHEVIVARHMGLEVLGISCVTNLAAGIQDRPLDHQEVLDTGIQIQQKFTDFVTALAPLL